MLKRPLLCESLLLKRRTQVTAWETIAPIWALLQERETLSGQRVFLFVDNTAAQFALSKGSSKAADLNSFCAAFWLNAARHNVSITILRVPSKENPADAPSRGLRPHGYQSFGTVVQPVQPNAVFVSGEFLRKAVPPEFC